MKMKVKIKICGIKRFEDIEYVNEAMPDYIGFVFAESRRKVDFNKAYLLKSQLSSEIKSVGVFVNEKIDFIKKCCDNRIIDMVQLHGEEDSSYIRKLKKVVYKPIIKAIRISDEIVFPDELQFAGNGRNEPDYPLFDTFSHKSYGGTGEAFNWDKIKKCQYPFFLAGGISIENVTEAIKTLSPYCVDASSSLETDGIKDREKIVDFVKHIRNFENLR